MSRLLVLFYDLLNFFPCFLMCGIHFKSKSDGIYYLYIKVKNISMFKILMYTFFLDL